MQKLSAHFKAGLTPDPSLTYFDWAEKYYILPPGSAVPGLINFSLTPYLVEPLQNFSWSSPVREEYWMKGIQIAASTLFDIVINGLVDYFPCPLIMYHGSDAMALEYVKLRLEPSFENNPKLRGKISDGYDKRGKSTHGLKIFPGGSLKVTGGISEKSYRSYSAAVVLMDDVDALPRDIAATEKTKGQGNPIDLARARTNGRMGKFKIGVSGSPTDTETSLIYEAFLKTDQRYYHVACPYCAEMQIIDFFRIKFEKNAADELIGDPALECISCKALIPESKKHEMMQLENGARWIPTKETSDKLIVGRHLSSAYSLIGYNWKGMCKDFIHASRQQKQGNSRPLRTFYNTKLGIPWDNNRTKKTIDHHELFKRREDWKEIPENGIIITSGVDIQANRIEILVCAHGAKAEVYLLEYKVIGGNTLIEYGLDGSPFNDLEIYLEKTFTNSYGHEQPILHTCIDMGFRSIVVSPFLYDLEQKGFPITGIHGSSSRDRKKNFVGNPVKNKYGIDQREINVDEGKTLNHHKLKNGLIHFNKHPSFTDDFFRQLTVEYWSAKDQRWICADHARNEATDMLNYSTAAMDIYSSSGNIDFEDFKKWNSEGCFESSGETVNVIDEGIRV
jgi:phage terminase large subunit GpA-like protein